MASISQRISNFLGGVSQQTDDLKFPGQVRELINGYPDPTFGLLKRPGGKFIAELKESNNSLIGTSVLDDAHIFTIFRDSSEEYLVALICNQTPSTNNAVKVWRLSDGTPVSVSYGANAKDYLSASKDKYHTLTVNDYTFITNTEKVITAQAAPSYTANKKATIRILTVEYSAEYKVVINGSEASFTTRNSDDTTGNTPVRVLNYEDIVDEIASKINALNISGLTVTKTATTVELSCSSAFTISAIGGQGGDALYVFQDTVENITRLPGIASDGRVVRVANTTTVLDDYYLEFVADSSGNGYWEETRSPSVSPGLTASTMPHQLVRQSNGTFLFEAVDWEDRLVGDETSNPDPSFVGSTISQLFFYNNRLGALSSDNIVLSQTGDYFNFFSQTATTSVASDPIDVSCSGVRPASLFAVIPTAQGLVLFSRTQQFLISADNGIITPQSVNITSISNYEMDEGNLPVDLGTTIAFVTKITSYTRVFEMETRGQQSSPVVVDISRLIPEWIPSTIDQVRSSPQNSILSLASSEDKLLYLFRFYSTGESRELQSWFKWELSGDVLHHYINEDTMYVVTKQEHSVVLQRIDLIQSPDTSTIQTQEGIKVDPRLDMWRINPTAVYDSVNDRTKIYFGYKHDSNLSPCVVAGQPTGTNNYLDIGLIILPDQVYTDGTGNYVIVEDQDLTSDEIIVGYLYTMDVELPSIYVRTGDNNQVSDLTSSLVISRMKVNVGLGGNFDFFIKAKGRTDWTQTFAVTDADVYLANDVPLSNSKLFTLPLHQKSKNMTIKVQASGPFPVSLLSIIWEGHYSGKYYNRR
jgi:hypothetical protein